jgi:hypothetical protein
MHLIWICVPHQSRGPVDHNTRTLIFLSGSRCLIMIKSFEIQNITDNDVLTVRIESRGASKNWISSSEVLPA